MFTVPYLEYVSCDIAHATEIQTLRIGRLGGAGSPTATVEIDLLSDTQAPMAQGTANREQGIANREEGIANRIH